MSTEVKELAPFEFTPETKVRADAIIAKYPKGRQQSAVMPLLDLAQRQHGGWLPQSALDYVADYLAIPRIRVYEVATFYTMYNLKPIGRHHVQVCTNLSCWLRGSEAILERCRVVLGVHLGQTTQDGLFTLSEVECLCACVNAPVVQIDDDFYEDLTPETIERVLTALRAGSRPPAGSQIGRRSSEPADGLTSLTSMPWAERVRPSKADGEH